MRKSLKALMLGSTGMLIATVLASTPPLAQQATTSNDTSQDAGNQEIVVTAQFREQSLQRTPIAITADNSAMLEARSQTNFSEVASQAPSVTLKPQGTSFGPAMGAHRQEDVLIPLVAIRHAYKPPAGIFRPSSPFEAVDRA